MNTTTLYLRETIKERDLYVLLTLLGVFSSIIYLISQPPGLYLRYLHLISILIITIVPLWCLSNKIFIEKGLPFRLSFLILMVIMEVTFLGVVIFVLSNIFDMRLLQENMLLGLQIVFAMVIISITQYSVKREEIVVSILADDVKICLISISLLLVAILFGKWSASGVYTGYLSMLYILIFVLAVIGSSNRFSDRQKLLIIYTISLAIILQNVLATPVLGAGDSNKEFYYSQIVISSGQWQIWIPNNKMSVVTIGSLHPTLVTLFSIPLESIYRTFYPLIFATVPTILFLVYKSNFSTWVSYWSSLLLVFLHPFFTVFAFNSRTGYGLVFVSLLLLMYLEGDRRSNLQNITRLGLILLIATSYYAIGPLLITIIMGIKIAIYLDSSIQKHLKLNLKDDTHLISAIDVILLLVSTTCWQIYTTQAITFESVSSVLIGVLLNSESLFSLSSSSGGAAFSQDFSYTYELITYEYVFLTVSILISLLLVTILRYSPNSSDISGNYYPVFVGGGLPFILAFLPTSILGIARLYTIGLIFLAPAALIWTQRIPSTTSQTVKRVVPTVFLCILLINTGVFGAIIGDTRIPQDHLTGDSKDTVSDYHSSKWTIEYSTDNAAIRGSGDGDKIKSYFFIDEYYNIKPPGNYSRLSSSDQEGLIYLSTRSVRNEDVTTKLWYSGGTEERNYVSYASLGIYDTGKVYDNNASQVRYR